MWLHGLVVPGEYLEPCVVVFRQNTFPTNLPKTFELPFSRLTLGQSQNLPKVFQNISQIFEFSQPRVFAPLNKATRGNMRVSTKLLLK
jgi:hypothetical protein